MTFETFQFIPVQRTPGENARFMADPDCQDSVFMTMDYYKVVGFVPPWIGYYVEINGNLVGAAAFKGAPVDNRVEIAYGTFPLYQQQGIGTEICRQLVLLALRTDPGVMVTARTLPEHNYSTKLLQSNNFYLQGNIWDKEDGDVWEWEYQPLHP